MIVHSFYLWAIIFYSWTLDTAAGVLRRGKLLLSEHNTESNMLGMVGYLTH